MIVKNFRVARTIKLGVLLPLSIICASSYAQSEDVQECRNIQDGEKRVACYDALYGRSSQENSTDTTNTTKPANQSSSEMDDIDRRAQALMNKNSSANTSANASLNSPAVKNKLSKQQSVDIDPQPNASPEDSFGAESIARNDTESNIDEMRAGVTDIKIGLRKHGTFTLDNGQVWKQTELSNLRIKSGETVIIKKGIFGAYYLSTDDSNRQIRVKRIQ